MFWYKIYHVNTSGEKTYIDSGCEYMKQVNEKCVLCDKSTDETVAMPVHLRKHYIEGAGQLCQDCYQNLYGNKDNYMFYLSKSLKT